MLKVVILIRRKVGTTPEEFRRHYEERHVPLILRHVGSCFADYRRSYPGKILAAVAVQPDALDFDVVTEIWVKDQATLDEMFRRASIPEIAAEIAGDEETFIDRKAVRMFLADEFGLARAHQ
jgi:uncharacterized protein (TIGR02118 family)